MHRFPAIAINAARMIADRLHELQRQHRELMTERVERRIARALLRLPQHAGRRVEGGVQIDFPLSRQDLAQMIGTTLFTVSRDAERLGGPRPDYHRAPSRDRAPAAPPAPHRRRSARLRVSAATPQSGA
jgi:hypothetical protein